MLVVKKEINIWNNIKNMIMKKLLLFVLAILFAIPSFAQIDEVELVVNGMAQTKEDAVTMALRSAIEQTFGAFVSANTTIVNDELTKDEIVSISSGNIKKYDEVSVVQLPDGLFSVTLSAVVSVNKLTAFAKEHGSSCEFAGNAFAQNMKLRELNKRNEEIAAKHLKEQLRVLEKHLFDISIDVGEPYLSKYDMKYNCVESDFRGASIRKEEIEMPEEGYLVPITLTIRSTKNSDSYLHLFFSTLKSLSLSQQEMEEYAKNNYPCYNNYIYTLEEDYAHYPSCQDFYIVEDKDVKGLFVIHLGGFRSEETVPVLKVYQQFDLMKIRYINTDKYIDFPMEVIVNGLYEGFDTYFEPRLADITMERLVNYKKNPSSFKYFADPWNRNDYFISSSAFAYKSLSDYHIKENEVKIKRKKETVIENNVVSTIKFDVFVSKEEMSNLTGFEIVYE